MNVNSLIILQQIVVKHLLHGVQWLLENNFMYVSKIEYILSVIHRTVYGAVCFQLTHLPCDYIENIYFVLLP